MLHCISIAVCMPIMRHTSEITFPVLKCIPDCRAALYELEWVWSCFMQAGKPLLHMAARGGNIELVDWLIAEHGFDVHQWIGVSGGGQPCTLPLHIAGTHDAVKHLMHCVGLFNCGGSYTDL